MRRIGVYDAKTQLPRLLDEVERGETILITRHGRPIARLMPFEARPRNVSETIEGIRESRRGVRLAGLSLKGLIDEGRH